MCGCCRQVSAPGLGFWKYFSLVVLLLPGLSFFLFCVFFLMIFENMSQPLLFPVCLWPTLFPALLHETKLSSLFPSHHHLRTALSTLMTSLFICSASLLPFFFFPHLPLPPVANPSDVLRVPACSVLTYTHLCSVSVLLS